MSTRSKMTDDHFAQERKANKGENQVTMITLGFKHHGQIHQILKTQGTSGPTKWNSIQQNLKKKEKKKLDEHQQQRVNFELYLNSVMQEI